MKGKNKPELGVLAIHVLARGRTNTPGTVRGV
jgi:hypothetical protein